MIIGFAGTGSMSLLFGYKFIQAGHETVFYNPDIESTAEIKKGITFSENKITHNFSPNVSCSPEILKDSEILFIFVKSYATGKAADAIKQYISNSCIIVTLQNGLGNIEILSSVFDISRIVFGSTTCGAYRRNKREIFSGGIGSSTIGGPNNENNSVVNKLLNSSELPSHITNTPEIIIWEKAVINAAINTLGAILNVPNGFLVKNRNSRELMSKIIRESVQSAAAGGIKIKYESILEKTFKICEATAENFCSMLQDIKCGRQTEIDSITGRIIKTGFRHGIDMPVNTAIYYIIRSLESVSSESTKES